MPQTLIALGLDRAEEFVNRRDRFELTHNARHRRAVVVDFGLFHASLTIGAAEEFQHGVEGLAGVVDDVGKSSALSVFQELFACNCSGRHVWPQFGSADMWAPATDAGYAPTNIVPTRTRKYKGVWLQAAI